MARLRFAISPMLEIAASLQSVRDPARGATHVRWMRGLRGELTGLDLAAALRLVPTKGYIPDFLAPPPSGPLAEIADQLDEMRAVPPDEVRQEVLWTLDGKAAPAPLAPFLSDPAGSLARLADQLEAYWERALAPHWPRIRRLLDADLAHRARRLTEGGPAALFADLNPGVRWREDRVEVEVAHDRRVELDGRGLLLLPSAFSGAQPTVVLDPPWQPALIYPARGVALLWDPGREQTPEALAGVLGRTRARILATLDAPRSTTELAEILGLTAGARRSTSPRCAPPGSSPGGARAVRSSTPGRRRRTSWWRRLGVDSPPHGGPRGHRRRHGRPRLRARRAPGAGRRGRDDRLPRRRPRRGGRGPGRRGRRRRGRERRRRRGRGGRGPDRPVPHPVRDADEPQGARCARARSWSTRPCRWPPRSAAGRRGCSASGRARPPSRRRRWSPTASAWSARCTRSARRSCATSTTRWTRTSWSAATARPTSARWRELIDRIDGLRCVDAGRSRWRGSPSR